MDIVRVFGKLSNELKVQRFCGKIGELMYASGFELF